MRKAEAWHKEMVLSDKAIREARARGDLVIEPFDEACVNTSSYDVTLGEYLFRESAPQGADARIYNMYDAAEVKRVWGSVERAPTYNELVAHGELPPDLVNIAPEDRIVLLKPGETILGHTQEFIGGVRNITTKMQARSSMGRNFIEVCKCSGFGDVGYASRWTMELTNNSQHYIIPLIVGRRLAQIVFFQTPPVEGLYKSKYQAFDAKEVFSKWSPEDMLPKLNLERELRQGDHA